MLNRVFRDVSEKKTLHQSQMKQLMVQHIGHKQAIRLKYTDFLCFSNKNKINRNFNNSKPKVGNRYDKAKELECYVKYFFVKKHNFVLALVLHKLHVRSTHARQA